jgi:hypothetical protein
MPLFRRRPDPRPTRDDGTTGVPASSEQVDDWVAEVAKRVQKRTQNDPAAWIDLLLSSTYAVVVDRMSGDEVPFEASLLARRVAKFGYEARGVELELLHEPSANERLGAFLWRLRTEQGSDLIGSAVTAAGVLVNASRKDPGGADSSLLEPLGLGHRAHARLFAVLAGGSAAVEPSPQAAELMLCARWGYYVHACEASLPVPLQAEAAAFEL